ncbi:glutathione S-transferase family protein [Bradyrhizobium sp. LHD-71]|uniref:glutathione S-transferase family protein n=1 Tax=Bradyrhizobium sp. LHD-71 TaxID=3072141 RepID=UPI00280FB54B|nr:glutathione S-transferase family protein [Bradyrhizobium sp. LHD-71]MDQ8731648.1 glutathione S-transferase family protein [Bradyrhizobium sp. LHD-71]
MTNIELFVAELCPFAARARLVLAEKHISATEIEVDLRQKPGWFLEISPNGKVPLLRHDGKLVSEATIIAEYVEEAFSKHRLLPGQPHARAQARAWVSFADNRLYAKTEVLLHSFDSDMHGPIAAKLADDLRFLEERGLANPARTGPYLLGAEFSLADLALYPWFEQVAVLERYRSFHFPRECQRLLAWQEAVADRAAVRAVGKPAQFYLERYARLLRSATA